MTWKSTIADLVGTTASEAIATYGPDRLGSISEAELCTLPGVGPISARRVVAALALAHEIQATKQWRGAVLSSPRDVYKAMAYLRSARTERLFVICLDARNRAVCEPVEVAHGGRVGVAVEPADILRPAIRNGAVAIVLVHNHPSGDPEPSAQDIVLTRTVAKATEIVGLQLLDHVVIGDGTYVSLTDRGLMS